MSTKTIQFIPRLKSLLCEPSFERHALLVVFDGLKAFSSNKKKAGTFEMERRLVSIQLPLLRCQFTVYERRCAAYVRFKVHHIL